MKKIIFVTALTVILIVLACERSDTYGQIIKSDLQFLDIATIIEHPDQYTGSDIGLRGKIAIECGSGCWFQLDDGTGQIHVDLTPGNFAIPQMVGKSVTVMGQIVDDNGRLVIYASGIAF